MPQCKTRWVIQQPIPEEISRELYKYPFLVKQILFNRGITSVEQADSFLRANAPEYNPFSLKGLEKAVEMIHEAITSRKKIIVIGDYDADGLTASALMVQVLQHYDAKVDVYIPNRFKEGYGLSMNALNEVLRLHPDLIITVDCGVRSVYEVEHALSCGVDVIITDHHQPHEILPNANAVICPKQMDDNYPYKGLAGVGIAYKLAQGLLERHPLPNIQIENWIIRK